MMSRMIKLMKPKPERKKMESGNIADNFSELTENVKKYINLRIDLLKLILTEKLAKGASVFLITVVLFILFMFLVLFLSFSFIFWYGATVGPTYVGALIIAGVYFLAGLVLVIFRTPLITNPLIRQITKALMDDKNEEQN